MPRRILMLALCALVAAHSAGQSGTLPERDTFLRETREALTRSQELWHRYSYKQRRTELHLNPFGRMGMGGTRVTEVQPSADPRLTYRRVIERNGAAVPPAELARQDAEHRVRVAEIKRQTAAEDADDEALRGSSGQARRQQDELLARRRAQMIVDDVVKSLQFDLVRREIRNGRPAIVIAFKGHPNARPTTREGRLAKVFSGQIWVEETTHEVMYLEGVAGDDVPFGGFVAKVYEGTKAVVVREEIEPGVWMPTRLTLSGDIRALFRRAKIDHVIEWFDYRGAP